MIDPQEAVFQAVRLVPAGKVVTYGQVADMVEGVALQARQVGGIMALCPEDVPWHRVVGAGGNLPIAKRNPQLAQKQHELLSIEGVSFLADGKVNIAIHAWMPDESAMKNLFTDSSE